MIQRKKKICNSCQTSQFLFSQGKCLQCYQKANNKPLKPSKAKIKPISDKHKIELEEYQEKRDAYMAKYPICQCCNLAPSQDLHHRFGRGIRINWEEFWMAVCRTCHEKIHSDYEWAIVNSYIISKISK